MLAEARRVVLVGPGEAADIVHTIGSVDHVADPNSCRVHTVERVPLRDGRLSPAPAWLRRERRRTYAADGWITHGQTAGRLLVEAGLVPGERVHCLPFLPYLDAATDDHGGASRARIRQRLGVAPGVRLVVGIEPHTPDHRAHRWEQLLVASGRTDVTTLRAVPEGSATADRYVVRVPSGAWLPEPFRLADLLPAADIVVATGHDLEAHAPATAAPAYGVPVIAVTTDSAAELVLAGARGCVVPPRAESIVRALVAQLDGVLPPRERAPGADSHRRLAAVARDLLGVYRHVLCASAIGGAA
jgi:glycosyltransferase involved in cell wall biosynthesis